MPEEGAADSVSTEENVSAGRTCRRDGGVSDPYHNVRKRAPCGRSLFSARKRRLFPMGLRWPISGELVISTA